MRLYINVDHVATVRQARRTDEPDPVEAARHCDEQTDEDVDFDGVVDRRFRGDQPADVPAGTAIPGEPFGKLECGAFHNFWWKR